MSSESMRQIIESIEKAQQLNEGSYDDRVARTADAINQKYSDGVYRKDLENIILTVGAEMKDFEVRGSTQAKRDYVKDVAKLVKKRRDNRSQEAKAQQVAKVLQRLADMIDDAIGASFPDSDPFDYIRPRARKIGIKADDLLGWLDRATKKHLGERDYHTYLKLTWQEHMRTIYGDNAEAHPNYSAFD